MSWAAGVRLRSLARALLGGSRPADLGAPLERAVAALRDAGFGTEAEQLVAAAGTPTSSSLEIAGEIGLAALRVEAGVGHLLPYAARRRLARLLREVRRSWPELTLDPPPGEE